MSPINFFNKNFFKIHKSSLNDDYTIFFHLSEQEIMARLTKDNGDLKLEARALKNRLVAATGKVTAIARLRPTSDGKQSMEWETRDDTTIIVKRRVGTRITPTSYKFDNVLTPSATQPEVFNVLETLIASSLEGFGAVVFAYGE
jgi:Microtubule binding